MDQADIQRIQQELDEAAKRLFPGAVRQAVVLQYGDDPIVEPGEMLLRLVAAEQVSDDKGAEPHAAFPQPEMKQFQRELSARLPGARRIEVVADDTSGHRKGFLIRVAAEEPRPDTDLTPVMVRMRGAELEIVDTLISVGIAANRAEAVRWALGRISERPAYAQLRERTREIERLKGEF